MGLNTIQKEYPVCTIPVNTGDNKHCTRRLPFAVNVFLTFTKEQPFLHSRLVYKLPAALVSIPKNSATCTASGPFSH